MQTYRIISVAIAAAALVSLVACSMSTPSKVETSKIRVKDYMVTETLDAKHVDLARTNVVADNYIKNSKGEMQLTVSYLKGTSVAEAEQRGYDYKRALEHRGASNISVITVPFSDKNFIDKIVISYKSLVALPPKGCDRIPGYQGTEAINDVDHYRFGCAGRTALSKMIADPSDLLGKGGSQDNDSLRSGTVINNYKVGTPNDLTQSFQASTVGSGG